MKLSYKIFAVYLLVSFILLFSVFATLRFYAVRHFQKEQTRLENEMLTILSYELALVYQRENNWNLFENYPETFNTFIQTALRGKRGNLSLQKPGGPPGPPEGPHRPGPDGPDGKTFLRPHQRIALYDVSKIKIAGPDF